MNDGKDADRQARKDRALQHMLDEMDKAPVLVFDVVECRPREPRCSACGGRCVVRCTDAPVVWYRCQGCGANIKTVRRFADAERFR